MAYTLNEAAVLTTEPLARGVIQTIADSPIFNNLPFIPVEGNAYAYIRTASLSDASFRAINQGYPESTPTFSRHIAELKRLGGDADVDRYLIKTQAGGVEELRAAATVAKAQAVRMKFVDTLINGDGSGESFEGIESWITADNEVEAPAGGFGSTSDSRQDMFDALDAALGKVAGGANALLMGSGMLSRFKSAARREGAVSDTVDDFGRTIQTYAGVPILDAGFNEDGEPVVATDDVYAVRFDANSGVAGVTNGGIQAYDLGELDEKPTFRTRIEFYCGAVMLHPNAVAVLRADVAP